MDFREFQPRGRPGGDLARTLRRYRSQITFGIVAALIAMVLVTVFYRVEAEEQAVILRFGKFQSTAGPGLHLKLPWPIDHVYHVPVLAIQTLEYGFDTESPGIRTEYRPRSEANLDVAEMLTGDLNLADVEWIVQYRVSDPRAYLFHIGSSEDLPSGTLPAGTSGDVNPAVPHTIHDVGESVMRTLIGDASIDDILTTGRERIAGEAKQQIQSMLDSFEAGIQVVAVKLQNTAPPDEVREAFQEVNRARQKKERIVNEAEGERNRQIPAARGKRDQMILEAEGYQERVVQETTGQVNAFLAQFEEFHKAPEVTRLRLYLETMEEVLGTVGATTVIDESVQGVLPLLNLDSQLPTAQAPGAQR